MTTASGHRVARYFAFLRRLRAGGRSNMYGAIPYLMNRFGLDRERAFRVVCEWLDQEAALQPATPPPAHSGRRRRGRDGRAA